MSNMIEAADELIVIDRVAAVECTRVTEGVYDWEK